MAGRLNEIVCNREIERWSRNANAFAQVSGFDAAAIAHDGGDIRPDSSDIVSDRDGQHFLGGGRGGYDPGAIKLRRPAIGGTIDHGAVAETVGGDHDRTVDLEFLFTGCRHDTASMIG